jgi:hypothetical protein
MKGRAPSIRPLSLHQTPFGRPEMSQPLLRTTGQGLPQISPQTRKLWWGGGEEGAGGHSAGRCAGHRAVLRHQVTGSSLLLGGASVVSHPVGGLAIAAEFQATSLLKVLHEDFPPR